jgi:hypothetical protein
MAMVQKCLEKFTFKALPESESSFVATGYQIFCKECDHSSFKLTEILADESAIAFSMKCARCDHEAEFFSVLAHGYDGVLGHNAGMDSGEQSRTSIKSEDDGTEIFEKIFVHFSYGIDEDELDEIAAEESVPKVDLFDWITVSVGSPDGDVLWDLECA